MIFLVKMDAIPARFLHNVVHPMPLISHPYILMAGISTSHGSCLRHWVAHVTWLTAMHQLLVCQTQEIKDWPVLASGQF